jgi:hypothetical protein
MKNPELEESKRLTRTLTVAMKASQVAERTITHAQAQLNIAKEAEEAAAAAVRAHNRYLRTTTKQPDRGERLEVIPSPGKEGTGSEPSRRKAVKTKRAIRYAQCERCGEELRLSRSGSLIAHRSPKTNRWCPAGEGATSEKSEPRPYIRVVSGGAPGLGKRS